VTLFKTEIRATDPLYTEYRDSPERETERKYLEELWRIFSDYADPGFKEEKFPLDFLGRFWEMALGAFLIKNNLKLLPNKGAGPDFQINSSPPVAIEAVAPGPGVGDDAVPSLGEITGHRSVGAKPDDKITLRIRHAIIEKQRKYDKYKNQGIIKPNECYVIAINPLKLGLVSIDTDPPHLFRATLGLGDPAGYLNRGQKEVELENTYRPFVYKQNLVGINTDIFLNAGCAGISAILVSFLKPQHRNMKPDIKLLHNSYAHNHLPMNFLPGATEYWIEGDILMGRAPFYH
jgi:hypothetical protein